jgi:hypothetical protein
MDRLQGWSGLRCKHARLHSAASRQTYMTCEPPKTIKGLEELLIKSGNSPVLVKAYKIAVENNLIDVLTATGALKGNTDGREKGNA